MEIKPPIPPKDDKEICPFCGGIGKQCWAKYPPVRS